MTVQQKGQRSAFQSIDLTVLAVDESDLTPDDADEKPRWDTTALAIAAHEIRNPLNALRFELELAMDSLRGRSDVPEDLALKLANELDRAIGSTLKIGRLVEDFAGFSLARWGKLSIESRQLDLVPLLVDIVRQTRKRNQACPPIQLVSPKTIRGFWDATRVEQIVSNLLDNAVRFSQGQPIDVTAGSEDDAVTLLVRDHGVGIAPERLERIFEPFDSVDGPGREHFGLGLWVVRQAVAAMGGRLSVSSQLGEGTSFTIEIPISPTPRQP